MTFPNPLGRLTKSGELPGRRTFVPGLLNGTACLFLLLFSLIWSGCDRPFVEQSVPTIEIVSPDPGIVQEEAAVTLLVTPNSLRAVERITLGGTPFEKLGDGSWRVEVELQPGINRLIVESFDSDDVAGLDTVRYLHLSVQSEVRGLIWKDPRGGHTATMLPNGNLILIGGSRSTSTPALPEIFVLPAGGSTVEDLAARLSFPRLGHTATMLPDGRILVAGGTAVPRLSSVSDLQEVPEIYDPVAGTMTPLVVEGPPIRRTYHTAEVYNSGIGGPVITLLGGTGDIQYTPSSLIGIRQDIRTFQLEGDTLKALSPAVGPFVEPLTGHSQTPLASQPPGIATRQLITGAIFLTGAIEAQSFILDPRSDLGLEFLTLVAPITRRTEHAAVLMAPGRVLRVSGVTTIDMSPEPSADLYDDTLGRFLSFGDDTTFRPSPRHLQSATNLGGGRILVLGGFNQGGTAPITAEYISFDL
jgi:hypothetical protein